MSEGTAKDERRMAGLCFGVLLVYLTCVLGIALGHPTSVSSGGRIRDTRMNVVLQQIEHSRFKRAQLARGWHAARREQHAHVKVASGTRVAARARAEEDDQFDPVATRQMVELLVLDRRELNHLSNFTLPRAVFR